MAGGVDAPVLQVGLASELGGRRRNEDYVAAARPSPAIAAAQGHALALADGVGGGAGGREAAETAIRAFLEGYYAVPVQWGPARAGARVIESINRWLVAQGRSDPHLLGMACTFTALVVRGRGVHVLHVGDSRAYRFAQGRLSRLTRDHCLDRPGLRHVLARALGLDDDLRVDYAAQPVGLHDRLVLCSDGVHGVLDDRAIAAIVAERASATDTARALVGAALAAGGSDNATALVADIVALPAVDRISLGLSLDQLPVLALPKAGDNVDGFRLERMLADGPHTRLFVARDDNANPVVLKFPRPRAATDRAFRAAFLRESWISASLRVPGLARVIEQPPERQSRLYLVLPYYAGETLEQRLGRAPAIGCEEGRRIGIALCRAVMALHRAGVVHRDIKPDNVVLEPDGGVVLLDLGVARLPWAEDVDELDRPGTPSFMAPELFSGRAGDAGSDLYALAATLYRAFTGRYPQGEIEPFTHPRFAAPKPLARERPDLPAWLGFALGRALAVDPGERMGDVGELLHALESGPAANDLDDGRRVPLYRRNPLLVWQVVAVLQTLALLWMAAHR